jgi:hypothetical protein
MYLHSKWGMSGWEEIGGRQRGYWSLVTPALIKVTQEPFQSFNCHILKHTHAHTHDLTGGWQWTVAGGFYNAVTERLTILPVRASKAFSAGPNTIRITDLVLIYFFPWMRIKLFPVVYSLHFIAFHLVALLPAVYVFIRAFIQSYLSNRVAGAKEICLSPSESTVQASVA